MQLEFSVQIWKEEEHYIAHAMPLDVASAGASPQEARVALDEAVRLFLQTAADHGTLEQVLEEAGYVSLGDEWRGPEWIAVERHVIAA